MQERFVLEEGHEKPLLYFWALGDLHYRAWEPWRVMHEERLAPMFEDLQALWSVEGVPAFCVSPGDVVDTGAEENYRLAKMDLKAHMGDVPFYPGIGNHEFHRENRMDRLHTVTEFQAAWGRDVRYCWTEGEVVCIMLDQPDPYTQNPERENPQVILSQETLTFLDMTLTKYAEYRAVIFAHCPLSNTVQSRDPQHHMDYAQIQFFSVDNSEEVRAILAKHRNAVLYISGHTHSGWGSPQLVFTEELGGHPVTHVNLMCPWYTGRRRGPRKGNDDEILVYVPDEPDMVATFGFWMYRDQAIIRARDHRAQQWLATWQVPL